MKKIEGFELLKIMCEIWLEGKRLAPDETITQKFRSQCNCLFTEDEVEENGFTTHDSCGIPSCVKCGVEYKRL